MTKEHPHADVLRAIADGVPIDDFECKHKTWTSWYSMRIADVALMPHEWQVRRKVKTITVNGFELPEPCRVMPKVGDVYYIPVLAMIDFCYRVEFDNSEYDKRMIGRGLMHLTKEAAIAHAKAMLGIDPAAKKPEAHGGWIEWNGGECPVSPDTVVECRMRVSAATIGDQVPAYRLRWTHAASGGDIVAYRIAKDEM